MPGATRAPTIPSTSRRTSSATCRSGSSSEPWARSGDHHRRSHLARCRSRAAGHDAPRPLVHGRLSNVVGAALRALARAFVCADQAPDHGGHARRGHQRSAVSAVPDRRALRSVVRPGGQEIPGAAPALGALAAVVCLSARPWAPRWLVLGIGAGVGAILWSITPFVLLAFNRWSLPLVRARRCGVGRHVTSRKGRFHGLIAASVAGFAVTDRCRGDTVIECASELPPEPSRVPGSSPRSSLNDRVEAALAPSPDGGWLWLHGS